jgi:hypothetical protein
MTDFEEFSALARSWAQFIPEKRKARYAGAKTPKLDEDKRAAIEETVLWLQKQS